MKRVLFSLFGTVAGIVALLSFKTHSPVINSALPAAGLPASAAGTGAVAAGSNSSAAPPNPAASTSTTPTATASTPAAAPSTKATSQAARSFLGTPIATRYGVVQVKITVTGSKITNVAFAQLTAFDDRSQEINSQAGPILLQETLTAQSASIDTVSGATYTTQGYEQSLQSALDQAGI